MAAFSNIRLGQQNKYIDKTFWIIFGILVVASVISLFSASSTLVRGATEKGLSTYQPIISHVFFLTVGAALAYIIQFLPSWFIRFGGYVALAFSVVCLLLIAAGLGVSANDAARWLRIGPIQFQPSELAKLSLIIVVADLLSRIKTEADKKKYFWISLGITGVVCGLIVTSNLSTVILIGGVVLVLMALARIPWRWLMAVVAVLLVCLVAGYFYVENRYIKTDTPMTGVFKRAETWVGRIDSKVEELQQGDTGGKTVVITSDNLQATMARIAVARGGLSPMGVFPGNSVMRNKLPLAYADYIFAIIVEETGIVGAIFLCFLYLSILFRACLATSRYANYAAMLMVMGLAIMLTTQAFISMAVAVGLGPVTGQPLPLISRGGTSVLITCIYFGIMMSVSREQNRLKDQERRAKEESRGMVPEITVE